MRINCTTLHEIHWLNRDVLGHAALNPMHSLRMHLSSLRGLHWIQSGSIAPKCIEFSAFHDTTWNPLHSIGMLWAMLQKIHCIQLCYRNPMHSIGMHWATLHRLHCMQSVSIAPQCKESSAFIDAAWKPLQSIGMLWAMLQKIHCFQSRCIKSTAFHHAA